MHKKFIKVTIERRDVTEDYDENFFDEYLIQEEKKIEKLSVSVITDITEAVDKTDDAFLKLTLANIAAKIGLIYVEINKETT